MHSLGKHPVRVISSLNGTVTADRVENLVVYQKADGTYYSNVYGGRTVTREDGEFIVRQMSKSVKAADVSKFIPPRTKEQKARDAVVLELAKKHFFVETLEVRGRDRLDFHDCGIVGIRRALE